MCVTFSKTFRFGSRLEDWKPRPAILSFLGVLTSNVVWVFRCTQVRLVWRAAHMQGARRLVEIFFRNQRVVSLRISRCGGEVGRPREARTGSCPGWANVVTDERWLKHGSVP
ncbi:hypothetical protein Fuma_00010 [Fuerstiella marisgermanici]|uniref:Uncharacterized protein n=1 Tax=Fuerstiella marisgermanici TaxID=1891926 RepID=A0A1P8W8Q3_9PLAN|nr:hypothetical protein Fuma_00010 [Fuerstiella marisgermanici]